ncbi:MAG: hypothetical protein IPJ03_16645 [Ignavibacteriales bacterium]|nr:hypothetical protein [Ignavibacteriales bacterium]
MTDSSEPDFEKMSREIVGWLYKEQAPSSNIVPIWHVHSTYGILKQDILKALSSAYAAGREEVLAKWPPNHKMHEAWNKEQFTSNSWPIDWAYNWLRNRLTIINKNEKA